jgi:hypothetical protein
MHTTSRLARQGTLLAAGTTIAALLTAAGTSPSWLDSPGGHAFKLASAAIIGVLITAVQRHTRGERTMSPSMEQAQVLLAVAGALMMLIIGDSLARAFGLAGAAAVIRFRTPVEDPRDVTVLFLLMGLGMACGLGLLPLAGLGTAFLAVCLFLLSRLEASAERCMKVAVIGNGTPISVEHVERVFAQHHVALEPLEITNGESAVMRYRARMPRAQSLDALSAQLLNGGTTGIKSVTWEAPKKSA